MASNTYRRETATAVSDIIAEGVVGAVPGTETLLRQSSCQEATPRHILKIPGLGFFFQQDAPSWRNEDATPSLSWSEMCQTSFLQHCFPRIHRIWILNPDDYRIWSVGPLQEKVYRSRIANELEMRVIDEWGLFDQSIVDAPTAASGAVVSALVSEEWGTRWAPNIKFQLFCHVSTKSY